MAKNILSIASLPPPLPVPAKVEGKGETTKKVAASGNPDGNLKVPLVETIPRLEVGLLEMRRGKSSIIAQREWIQDFRLSWWRINISSEGNLHYAPSLNVTHKKMENIPLNLQGAPITTQVDLLSLAIAADLFYDPIKYLGAFTGTKFGLFQADFTTPIDGKSGNSIGSWGLIIGFRAGVRIPEIKVSGFLSLGAQAYYQIDYTQHNLVPDWSARPIALSMVDHSLIIGISGTIADGGE